MDSFLFDFSKILLQKYRGDLANCTVVFPNKRAGLFLKKALTKQITKTTWAPKVQNLEDFLLSYSSIQKADNLQLIYLLYQSVKKHQPENKGFSSFFFWGEMLLRDFSDIDHHLVEAKSLFHWVKSDKEIQEQFNFLTDEAFKNLQEFWKKFFPTSSPSQNQFVETWKILHPIYQSFKSQLRTQNIGYTAHIYREMLNEMPLISNREKIIFVGFNALTVLEKKHIENFISHYNAEIFWDWDAYYVQDPKQEAGHFFRHYAQNTFFKKSFTRDLPSNLKSEKSIHCIGVSSEVGQAQLLSEKLQTLLEKGVRPEEIVVVLPKEYMLFPVLNSLPQSLQTLNITMGLPLKETPFFGLVVTLIQLRNERKEDVNSGHFYSFKSILQTLNFAHLFGSEKNTAKEFEKEIRKENKVRIYEKDVNKYKSPLLNTLFFPRHRSENIVSYLLNILKLLNDSNQTFQDIYLHYTQNLLERLKDTVPEKEYENPIDFKNLFSKICASQKVPFSGEPLEGLQIMGVLETRNLDFKHVFVLNMNEESFPQKASHSSFIPYRIRKAFQLPTFEKKGTIYAYLFYRLIQRAQNIDFFYTLNSENMTSSEPSRFLHQLTYESPHTPHYQILTNDIGIVENKKIEIEKTPSVLSQLEKYTEKGYSKFSASLMNTYLKCSLQFYFKYVLKLFSKQELSDTLDARSFGNIAHETLEFIYKKRIKEKANRKIEKEDFIHLNALVNGTLNLKYRELVGIQSQKNIEIKGKDSVWIALIEKFIKNILAWDEKYAPFAIKSMEKENNYQSSLEVVPNKKRYKVTFYAYIDRVDIKENVTRLIDYKSGKVDRGNSSLTLEKLFSKNDSSRNKEVFQTLYYAWIYQKNTQEEGAIMPCLVSMSEIMAPDFNPRLKVNEKEVWDATPFLADFEDHLKTLTHEIFNEKIPFSQTEDEKTCEYCDFKSICGR